MLAIFLDIEATGLDFKKHKPIDLAFKIVDPNTGEIKAAYQSVVKQSQEIWDQSDPASIEINGYTWERVQGGKDSNVVKVEVIDIFSNLNIKRGKAVFICQNPSLDRALFTDIIDVYTQEKLNWPYHWLDFASMYWAYLSQKLKQSRKSYPNEVNLSKNSIAQKYKLETEGLPHLAMNGVDHLLLCYKAVIGFPLSV